MTRRGARGHLPTVAAIAVVTYALSIVLHEGAHAVAGLAAGGDPTLISSTDLRGEWSGVSTAGFVSIGIAGSAANVALAALALLVLRSKRPHGDAFRFFAWLVFAVNGFIPAFYMLVSPVLGFGDWMTILSRLPSPGVLRVLTACCGALLTLGWFRMAARYLAPLLRGYPYDKRLEAARRWATISWVAGGSVAVLASLLSPLGLTWAVPIAVGSTMGTTWPMLPAARRAAAMAPDDGPGGLVDLGPSLGWLLGALVVGLIFVVGFGRGIAL